MKSLGRIDTKRARELGLRADMDKPDLEYCGPSRVEIRQEKLTEERQHMWKEKSHADAARKTS